MIPNSAVHTLVDLLINSAGQGSAAGARGAGAVALSLVSLALISQPAFENHGILLDLCTWASIPVVALVAGLVALVVATNVGLSLSLRRRLRAAVALHGDATVAHHTALPPSRLRTILTGRGLLPGRAMPEILKGLVALGRLTRTSRIIA